MTDFHGWPDNTFDYFSELASNNNRDWYDANKTTLHAIETASRAVLAKVDPNGEVKIFRLRRDARFAKDQPPYKTTHRAGIMLASGIVQWVDISADGITISTGQPAWDKHQLQHFRTAVADNEHATTLASALESARSAELRVDEPELKKPLRHLNEDHPHPDLSRHKHLTISSHHHPGTWITTNAAVETLNNCWTGAAPATKWLATHVGPGTQPAR